MSATPSFFGNGSRSGFRSQKGSSRMNASVTIFTTAVTQNGITLSEQLPSRDQSQYLAMGRQRYVQAIAAATPFPTARDSVTYVAARKVLEAGNLRKKQRIDALVHTRARLYVMALPVIPSWRFRVSDLRLGGGWGGVPC
jgi:hypothetical protein